MNFQCCENDETCTRPCVNHPQAIRRRPDTGGAQGAQGAQGVIEAREAAHGDYREQALTAYTLKSLFAESAAEQKLKPEQWEALDMIAVKISRILHGDPNEPDHWRDIAGYATLVLNILTKGTHL